MTKFSQVICLDAGQIQAHVREVVRSTVDAGVGVRRVEDTRVRPSTVSKLNQKIYAQIETWRSVVRS